MSKKRVSKKAKAKKIQKQRLYWGMLIGVLLIIFGGIFYLQNNSGVESTDTLPLTVNVSEAVKLQDDGAFVLDVRQPEEWNDYHAPDSILIPLDQLEARLDEVPRDRDIVVVCRSGNRSQSGRDILLNAGFTSVTSMAGGLQQWRTDGHPVVSGP